MTVAVHADIEPLSVDLKAPQPSIKSHTQGNINPGDTCQINALSAYIKLISFVLHAENSGVRQLVSNLQSPSQ